MENNMHNNRLNWFVVLRFFLPLFMLSRLLSFKSDISVMWSENGLVKPDILALNHSYTWYNMMDLLGFVNEQLGLSITFDGLLQVVLILFVLSLLSLSLGLLSKLTTLTTILFHLLIYASFYNFIYGLDNFITILLFYLLLTKVPTGALSLDNYLFGKTPLNAGIKQQQVLRVVQVHLCITYFFSGFEKAMGYNWWNGESIWRALHNNLGVINLEFIDSISATWVFVAAGWATIIVELLYPVFVNIRKTRIYWVAMAIGMHLSIVFFLGLFHFGILMALFNWVAFVVPYQRATLDLKWPQVNFKPLLNLGK